MNERTATQRNERQASTLKVQSTAALPLLLAALLWPLPTPATTFPNTVALWLFDETSYPCTPLLDATQNRCDLRLTRLGQLAAGKYGNALRLSPGTNFNTYYSEWDGAVVPNYMRGPDGQPSGLWGPTVAPGELLRAVAGFEWTCEFWLKVASAPAAEAAVLHFGYAYDPGMAINLTAAGASFRLTNAYGGWSAVCPIAGGSLPTGVWHHVAFTAAATGNRVRLFLNGQQQAGSTWSAIPRQSLPETNFPPSLATTTYGIFDNSQNYERFRSHRFNLSLGEDRHGTADLDAYLDEIRVSSGVYYTNDFTLPGSFSHNYGLLAPADSVANGPAILFGTNAPTVPVPLGNRRHLFIDGALLDATNNVQWQVNIPRIEPMSQAYGGDLCVIDHAGKVWFVAPDGYEGDEGCVDIYESSNGTNFTAPSLGVIEYHGSTNNNVVLNHVPMWAGVFKDTNPNIPADERFKLTGWVANSGIELFTSGDLIHWRRNETMMLPLVSGGGAETYWDDQNGFYQSFLKRDPPFYSGSCAYAGGRTSVGFRTRSISREWPFQVMASPYFAYWAPPTVTCEGPVVFGTNSFGEVYRSRAIKYPWAPDVYLAFVWRLSWERVRRTELHVSRDGTNWTGLGQIGLYLPSGLSINNFTNGEAVVQYGLVRRGDSIWHYANFNNGNHDYSTAAAFARLVQRLDGFVSLDAGAATGLVTTRPLVFSGSRLALNLDSRNGVAKVALLDTNGVELAGYGLNDCNPITTNSVNQIVTWNGGSSLASLSGTPLRVRVQMTQSKLYAMQFAQTKQVVVDSLECWNGLDNPHVVDGVTLSGAGTAATPYVYTIPAGMRIVYGGTIRLSASVDYNLQNDTNNITFKFTGSDLQIDSGGWIDVGHNSRNVTSRFLCDLGGGSVTGGGRILGIDHARNSGSGVNVRFVTITNATAVSLADLDLHTENINTTPPDLRIYATNGVSISGTLDTRCPTVENNAGNCFVSAGSITVSNVDTHAGSGRVNGSIQLKALNAAGGWSPSYANNAYANQLIINGAVTTAGGAAGGGGVALYGVPVRLNGGYSLALASGATLDLRAGMTNASTCRSNLFVNVSAQNPTVAHTVTWNNLAPAGSGPVFTTNLILRAAAAVGASYSNSIAGAATDPNGDPLSYAKGVGPAWLALAANGTLTGVLTLADMGTNTWAVSVTDGARFALASLRMVVRTKPAFLTNLVIRANAANGAAYSGSLADAAQDLDGDSLSFAKESGPAWLSVAANGTLSGTPALTDTFINEWIVSVTDGPWTNLTWLRINVCGPPKFWSDPITKSAAWTNENYASTGQTLAGNAGSPCGAPLTFSKTSGPAWLIVAADGTLSGTPTGANLGTNTWVVSVTDGSYSATATLRITVPTPIVITSREQWDGINNPHAAQGVTLTGSGTLGDPAVYTIGTHLRIASTGNIVMSTPPPAVGQDLPPDNTIVLKFAGCDLKLETNAYINIGRRARTGSQSATLSLGGGSILGSGVIMGMLDSQSSPRVLRIDEVNHVSLASIDLHVLDVASGGRNLTITASGKVEIGSIDNRDVQTMGGDAGDVNISAGMISVGPIQTSAARNSDPPATVNNGNITLNALGSPFYDPTTAAGNTIKNRLILSGLLSTATGTLTHRYGNITLRGVVVELKPDFGMKQPAAAAMTLNAGVYPNGVGATAGDVFNNQTTNALPPGHVVQWTTSPTMTVVTSSANPACPGSAVSFTATVTAAGSGTPAGTVQFQTNGVSFGNAATLLGGSATSVPVVLPAGNRVVTAVYNGNTNYGASISCSFLQTVRSNSMPMASHLSMGAFSSAPSTLKIIGGSLAPTDVDADTLLVTAVTPGSKGSVTTDGTNVTYTATSLFTGVDTFTYTVSDACSSSVPATVTVAVLADSAGFNELTPVGSIVNNAVVLTYLGLPDYHCTLEWTTNLSRPITWVPVVTNTVATNGWLTFTNTLPALPSFFRTRYFP